MKRKTVGLLGVIIGGLFLSLELYLLKVIQMAEKASGEWFEDVWRYAGEFPCNVALLVTVLVLLARLSNTERFRIALTQQNSGCYAERKLLILAWFAFGGKGEAQLIGI